MLQMCVILSVYYVYKTTDNKLNTIIPDTFDDC